MGRVSETLWLKFITQSRLFIAFEFIFILRHIFCLPKKASTTIFSDGLLTSLFSANKVYYVVFLSFFCIQLFPTFLTVQVFLGSRFSRAQVFQGPGPGFRSSLTFTIKAKNSYLYNSLFVLNSYTNDIQ